MPGRPGQRHQDNGISRETTEHIECVEDKGCGGQAGGQGGCVGGPSGEGVNRLRQVHIEDGGRGMAIRLAQRGYIPSKKTR